MWRYLLGFLVLVIVGASGFSAYLWFNKKETTQVIQTKKEERLVYGIPEVPNFPVVVSMANPLEDKPGHVLVASASGIKGYAHAISGYLIGTEDLSSGLKKLTFQATIRPTSEDKIEGKIIVLGVKELALQKDTVYKNLPALCVKVVSVKDQKAKELDLSGVNSCTIVVDKK